MGSSDSVHLAVAAAQLLGRWKLVAEKHEYGCSCCPGLGNVTMDEVEGRIAAWLRDRHALFAEPRSVTALLKDCIARAAPAGPEVLQPLFRDLDEALEELERAQRGL